MEGQDFKADSWSMAVDSRYLLTHRKNVIKRQDVIYEFIQTELHHMRTLHIMERVFQQGMLEELQLEPSSVHAIFPCLEPLIRMHSQFLAQLLLRRNNSLESGSSYNFTIRQLGDILLQQFSGQCADDMQKTYAEFCSRHLKAVKLYKELLARDKRFQSFIRRVSRGPLLRCHGVQECILLVTQRISKYPVLIQRILDNTTEDEEEVSSLAQALTMVRELLSSINQQMCPLQDTFLEGASVCGIELLADNTRPEPLPLTAVPGPLQRPAFRTTDRHRPAAQEKDRPRTSDAVRRRGRGPPPPQKKRCGVPHTEPPATWRGGGRGNCSPSRGTCQAV
ncbi:unnamed protein product [Pleuronectes platessa]|uniref:DH domain-containing protein n=1 Tax=Pleuronectes platessa TaxID=8262 RepID=A0A9N7UGL6_PLEPL|nr:unnamed protein product [Pleuronectes platessa]